MTVIDRLWTEEEWRAAMSTAQVNDLPDSDFAYIESGGEKDDDGKTTPRSLRHYPINDAAHVRNALARAGAAMEGDDADAKKIAKAAMPKIKAAAKTFDIEVSDESKAAGAECSTCDGSGKIRAGKVKCPDCDGTGKKAEAKSAPSRSVEWRKRKSMELRGTERRHFALRQCEMRASDDGSTLHFTGYASITDTPYDMGWYDESIKRGAFKTTLNQDPDVQLLINHGGLPLARTKSGTLTLTEDNTGLKVDAELDPEDPDVQGLARKMARGDVDQMSFAFRAVRQTWNADFTDRSITECDIHRGDVSVVNQGANGVTTASIRSEDAVMALRRVGALGLVETWFEGRSGGLEDDDAEILTNLLRLAAADDDELAEAQTLIPERLAAAEAAGRPLFTFPARATPTAADSKVSMALNAVAAAVVDALAAQSADPDNNTDPDDAKVWADLKALHALIATAIQHQAADGNPDEPDEGAGTGDGDGAGTGSEGGGSGGGTGSGDSTPPTAAQRAYDGRSRLAAVRQPPRRVNA